MWRGLHGRYFSKRKQHEPRYHEPNDGRNSSRKGEVAHLTHREDERRETDGTSLEPPGRELNSTLD